MILIIGSAQEYHSKYIFDLLKSKNEKVAFLDSRQIPTNFITSWYATEQPPKGYLYIDNQKIYFEDIKSVYWRWYYGIAAYANSNSAEDLHTARMIQREFTSYIESLFSSLDCLWVNSLKAINMHKTKTYQLHKMATNGIRVPKTLITNDKDELKQFTEGYDGELIFKPVLGGAHTEIFDINKIPEERLDSLKFSPVKFQEKIEGVDIRAYCIGNEIFTAEIRTDAVDFRDDANAKIVPVEIPQNIKDDCFKIMDLFHLKMTGIDIKYNEKNNEYVFIEANPAPMFTYFEEKSKLPISETLCELLIKGN